MPRFFETAFTVAERRMGLNYGLNRVRFPAPVPVDSCLRGRFKLVHCEPVEGAVQLTIEVSVERWGGENRSALLFR